MQYQLRPYQERIVQVMQEQTHHYLALPMGLGKTLIVLEFLRRTNQKALIVAPLIVAQRTWPTEVKKFGFDFKVAMLHGPGKDDLLRTNADLKIVNWDGIKWLGEQIESRGSHDLSKRVLILDEATAIKAIKSKRFQVCRRMQHFFKAGIYCLSGTPMPNGYTGLWTQYWMLDRGRALEATFTGYKRKYFFESGPPRFLIEPLPGAIERIQGRIKPLTSALLAEDYVDVPEVVHNTWHVQLPAEARKAYNLYKDENPFESAGVITNKYRQITQGALYNEDKSYTVLHTEKVQALKEILELADGEPVLCAVYFKFEVEMIQKEFGKMPVIAGGTSEAERRSILDHWDRRSIPLLLVHPASLSHGVNMQYGGSRIVWYGMPWSLEQYQQLNGRLIRPGQTEPVKLTHISCLRTKDQRVFEVLENKNVTQADFMAAMRASED